MDSTVYTMSIQCSSHSPVCVCFIEGGCVASVQLGPNTSHRVTDISYQMENYTECGSSGYYVTMVTVLTWWLPDDRLLILILDIELSQGYVRTLGTVINRIDSLQTLICLIYVSHGLRLLPRFAALLSDEQNQQQNSNKQCHPVWLQHGEMQSAKPAAI